MKNIKIDNDIYSIYESYSNDNYSYFILEKEQKLFFLKKLLNHKANYINSLNMEIEILPKLFSKRVPKLIKYVKDEFILLSYIEGNNLCNINIISISNSLLIVMSLCKILNKLHSLGYVHNDLKGGNILIGEDNKVYLVDFGNSTKIGEIANFGLPNSSSPELLKKEPLDNRSDIYSLGVLLHDLIDKTKKFDFNNYEEIMEAKMNVIPYIENDFLYKDKINEIIAKSSNPFKEFRYNNVVELYNDLVKVYDFIK